MSKKKEIKTGKLTKWVEIQIGFEYYSNENECNVKVLGPGTKKLTHLCKLLGGTQEIVELLGTDLTIKKS